MQVPIHLKDKALEVLNNPYVDYVHNKIERLSTEVEGLKAEIRLLKGHSPKPVIPPNSNLEGSKSRSEGEVKKNSLYQAI